MAGDWHGAARVWTDRRRGRWTGRLVLPAVAALVCAYFVHHSLNGTNGWYAREARLAVLAERQAEAQALADEHERLRRRSSLLNGTTIERDVLDERSRAALGLARPDEVIVMLPNTR